MPQEDSSDPSPSSRPRTRNHPVASVDSIARRSFKRLPDLIVEEIRPWGVINKFSCLVSDSLKKPK